MRFARLGPAGYERPAVQIGGEFFDISSVTHDIDGAFLEADPVGRVTPVLGTLPRLDPGLRIGSPVARPSAILCIGQNYAEHAAESGNPPPKLPILFLKTPNTLAGPFDDVEIPRNAEKTDWEVELGVVIGRRASYLDSPEQSMDHVAGFLLGNDVSERAFQQELSGGQWSKGKSAPGFSPLGPELVTPDEFDHRDARLRSWVNGEPRQDSTTADMIFSVEYLIHHLSQFLAFEPGDVILTGTPKGVALSGNFPYLRAGDIVEVEIEGLGRQRQLFTEWAAR